ncbi:MAG: hypothetical protein AB1630_10910, partial [bacterium]
TITYTLYYKNTGNTELKDIILTDYLPNNSITTYYLGSLTQAQDGTITIDYYITEPPGSNITNKAEIIAKTECDETIASSSSLSTYILDKRYILHIPKDYPTIQKTINVARENSTIYVSSGTYQEAITINKGISLIGNNATITAEGLWTDAIRFEGKDTDKATITGFTIIGADGNGISCTNGSPTIVNNRISDMDYCGKGAWGKT